MARIDTFLRLVVAQRASDLHLHAGSPPHLRVDGALAPLQMRAFSSFEVQALVAELMDAKQQAALERDQQVTFVREVPGLARFRATVLVQRHGMAAVFRSIPLRAPSLEELGLPDQVARLTRLANGLVLVAGPSGSGKTTTLAAMVNEINRTSRRHVLIIEDPIEFVHEPQQSAITQREIGRHTESNHAALRAALREAPDVLVVGELRDPESIALALSAAETGVLVLGTLHTRSAAQTVSRVLEAVPEGSRDQMRGALSVLLRGVVAQQLCRRADGRGRVAVTELMLQSQAVAHMIREGKQHLLEGHLRTLNTDGSHGRDQCLARHVRSGLVTMEDASAIATHPAELRAPVSRAVQAARAP